MTFSESYGTALFELAHESGVDGRIRDELFGIRASFSGNKDAEKLLDCPGIPLEERQKVVCDALTGAHPFTLNFILILTEARKIRELDACIRVYSAEYDKAHGIEHVKAVTALPMNRDELERLRKSLEKKRHTTVILENRVDPDILGGIIIEYPDSRTDASIAGSLDCFRSGLSE